MTRFRILLGLAGDQQVEVTAMANTPAAALSAAYLGHKYRDPRPIQWHQIVGLG